MTEIDSLKRERIREWQIRRLKIKEQMQLQPEQTLPLSKLLDLMDEEHAEILSGSKCNLAVSEEQDEMLEIKEPAVNSSGSVAGRFDLQLSVSARSLEGLRRLLKMAVYELQEQIDMNRAVVTDEHRKYPGGMSGTLGDYQFELGISGEACYE